ncbi:hypothetical protein J6TS1_17830 [Siminovitchia terrae]|uniref:Uncharacterized protein n=1 Tax=Siminovitchia terrae TaxID=1914933 RepID=A0ABQ4KV49_SIMTE|nr:hypothetical protein [Siminovitchia terrae]GIN93693.1 hypothetical protein J22TS1_47440 [Siminovitchia terrae]GIN95913.1 hypothetical protein J6TS1_17830 [Siminovitchia terrae]
MIKKVLLYIIISQLLSTNAIAQTNQHIQIFDVNKGKVIKNVQMNTDLQQEVEKFLEGITGVYVKINPFPNKGFMIRVPLEPNVMARNQWFNDLVDEVIIIFSGQEDPYIMVFDNENRPYFFTFESDTVKFMGLLNFKP